MEKANFAWFCIIILILIILVGLYGLTPKSDQQRALEEIYLINPSVGAAIESRNGQIDFIKDKIVERNNISDVLAMLTHEKTEIGIKIDNMEKELRELDSDNDKYTKALTTLEPEITSAEEDISTTEALMDPKMEDIKSFQFTLDTYNNIVASIQNAIDSDRTNIENANKMIGLLSRNVSSSLISDIKRSIPQEFANAITDGSSARNSLSAYIVQLNHTIDNNTSVIENHNTSISEAKSKLMQANREFAHLRQIYLSTIESYMAMYKSYQNRSSMIEYNNNKKLSIMDDLRSTLSMLEKVDFAIADIQKTITNTTSEIDQSMRAYSKSSEWILPYTTLPVLSDLIPIATSTL